MPDLIDKLPAALWALVAPNTIQERPRGRLGTRMYRLSLLGGERAYLKIAPLSSEEDLPGEHRRLRWLEGKLMVPRSLYYGEEDGLAFLLIAELSGEPAHHDLFRADPARLLGLMAAGLRQLHATPIDQCPFQSTAREDLGEIQRRLRRGAVDRYAFVAHNDGMTPEDARDQLAATGHLMNDLVLTHGDFYLPNVIVKDWALSGFIDLALVGVADRYRDLTAMADSIRMNLGPEWIPAFVTAYGLDALDAAKLRYYTLLDQFFTDFGG